MQTEAELFEQFRRFQALQANQLAAQAGGLPRHYHGPIDLNYVRPPATEFPKLCYKASKVDARGYITRLVQSKVEQDALPKGWLTNSADVHMLLDPLVKAQYLTADDIPDAEPEEKEASIKAKQAAKDKGN